MINYQLLIISKGKFLARFLPCVEYPINQLDLKQIANALLEILIYLHERQPPVIHRDIKPSNILLTNRYQLLKLTL